MTFIQGSRGYRPVKYRRLGKQRNLKRPVRSRKKALLSSPYHLFRLQGRAPAPAAAWGAGDGLGFRRGSLCSRWGDGWLVTGLEAPFAFGDWAGFLDSLGASGSGGLDAAVV